MGFLLTCRARSDILHAHTMAAKARTSKSHEQQHAELLPQAPTWLSSLLTTSLSHVSAVRDREALEKMAPALKKNIERLLL